ncbi:MAG: hypothetical protein GY817_09260 [bacterium]|nr:hypothetical protein [bacterium]
MQQTISIVDNFKNSLQQKTNTFITEEISEAIYALYFDVEECFHLNKDKLAELMLNFFNNQKFEEIETVFLDYIRMITLPDNILSEYYFKFAKFQEILMDTDKAFHYYHLAFKKNECHDFKFIDGLISILVQRNDLKKAESILADYISALQKGSDKLLFFDSMILLYLNNKELAKAMKLTEELMEFQDAKSLEYAHLLRVKGEILLEMKEFISAKALFEKTLEIVQDAEDIQDIKLIVYSHLSFIAKMFQDFQQALGYNDQQIKILGDDIFADLDVERLIELLWDNARIFESLGDKDQAKDTLNEAINLLDDHPVNDTVKSYLIEDFARLSKTV